MRLPYLLLLLSFGCLPDGANHETNEISPPTVVPVADLVAGRSYGDWIADWSRWVVATPYDVSPIVDPTGASCTVGQSGEVWFLTGSFGQDPIARSCTIPADKTIFLPLLEYFDDYPCPDTGFGPGPGQTLEEFLAADAAPAMDNADVAQLTVDGVAFEGLDHRARSPLFDFTADLSFQAVDGCITGGVQQGLTDGYWMAVDPLPTGEHELHVSAHNPDFGGFTQDVTWNVTVE